MCKPFSAIVTRNSVLWSRTSDRHETIIAENHLNDKTTSPDFVRVELTPKNGDFRKPIADWEFTVDQDFLPDWWSREWAETVTRDEAPKWVVARTITSDCEISDGTWFVFEGAPVITNSGTVWTFGQSAPVIKEV